MKPWTHRSSINISKRVKFALQFLHLNISSVSFLLLSQKQIESLHPISQVIQNYIQLSLSCENLFFVLST